jgi:Ca2+-binding RTX toxin-like protein
MSGFASIYGGNGDDALAGTTDGDFISGHGGNDVITADTGDDMVLAGDGMDTVHAGGGDDLVLGGAGGDSISGAGGEDTLLGGADNDTILGGGGADIIGGDAGDDLLNGNGGSDTFVFSDDFGHDLIIGFTIGTDTLQIEAGINGISVASPSDILGHLSSDGFGNAVITLGSDTITLQGLTVADVTANIGSIVNIV